MVVNTVDWYTIYNDTYSVHKRGLVLWRARLLCSQTFCNVSWRAGPPGFPRFQDGPHFPRVRALLLFTVQYKYSIVPHFFTPYVMLLFSCKTILNYASIYFAHFIRYQFVYPLYHTRTSIFYTHYFMPSYSLPTIHMVPILFWPTTWCFIFSTRYVIPTSY